MKTGRPRKVGIWTAKLMKLYRHLGYNMDTITKRFNISRSSAYQYTAKGGYNGNVKKRLRQDS